METFLLDVKALGACFVAVAVIGFATNVNASTQCSFNPPLYFEPQLFPNYPQGNDGNSYESEEAALYAARMARFGPTGVYQRPERICVGIYRDMNLTLFAGDGVTPINFFQDLWVVPKGISALVETGTREICNYNTVLYTRVEVSATGHGLTCKEKTAQTVSFFGPTSTRPSSTLGAAPVTFTAVVAVGNQPKAGASVNFSVDVTPNSGGHEHHDVVRPKGNLSPIQGTTDANGEVKLIFTAPEVAGIYTISANCTSCSNGVATKEIRVKVPDLVPISPRSPLNTDGTYIYALTSVDAIHAGEGRYHKNQYYLTEQAGQNLLGLIKSFAAAGWGTVALNDASLYWGGLYDIKGNWVDPHLGHRDGREIDISFTRARNPISPAKQKAFYKKFCEDKAVEASFSILHHYVVLPHYHVYLEKQKACNRMEK
jgi:hypothetical protein